MRLLQLGFALALASGFSAIIIYITGVSNSYEQSRFSNEDLEALQSLKNSFQKCVISNGLGLKAVSGREYCQVILQFPSDTVPKWVCFSLISLKCLSLEFKIFGGVCRIHSSALLLSTITLWCS